MLHESSDNPSILLLSMMVMDDNYDGYNHDDCDDDDDFYDHDDADEFDG